MDKEPFSEQSKQSPNTLSRSGEELQSAQGSRCIPKREVLKMSAGTGHVTGGS